MKKIKINKVDEIIYHETLDNGLNIYIYKTEGYQKKCAYFQTKYGSLNNEFVPIGKKDMKLFPLGIAHFLEHKLFESNDDSNVFELFEKNGAYVNAATSYEKTVYFFSSSDHFYENLNLLIDMIENPYFTDENVEKEKGIIGQEIKMYEDDPGWQLYMNALDCMYKDNPIKIDIAGTVESISKITPEILYKCYNTFYNPANMTMVVCGDFEPEKLLEEIKRRLVKRESQGEIKRIYPKAENEINMPYKEKKMEVSTPAFVIGYKDMQNIDYSAKTATKRHIAIEILLNMIIGKSSNLYKELYEKGIILAEPSMDYEFTKQYAHVIISGQSNNPEEIQKRIKETVMKFKEQGIEEQHFDRIRKKVYGDYVVEYNSVGDIARMFLADNMKEINSFDYIEEYETVTKQYVEEILKDVFKEENMVLSIIK